MISRIRSASNFVARSAGAFAGLLAGGMLTLGAANSFAQPPKEVEFSIEKYKAEAKDAWARYLRNMEEGFGQMEEFEGQPGLPDIMVSAWREFLEAFAQDDPFSPRDEELRARARERLTYWQGEAGQEARLEPVENPDVCLRELESAVQPDVRGGSRLGRVFLGDEVIEPVLIRKNAAGYSYRRCSGERATEVEIAQADMELFNSALVARFETEETEELTTYRQVPGFAYEPDGETKLTFHGAGSMLEARRVDGGHVEVTAFSPRRVTILLVATRTAMEEINPRDWEESWGDQPEDFLIERELFWWELARSARLIFHPAVESFEDLLSGDSHDLLVAGAAAGSESDWKLSLETADVKTVLTRATSALLIAEKREHFGLAQAMLSMATETNSDIELDIGTIELDWRKKDRMIMEEAANWGRFLPLVRLYDLAAIMPDRIAGKIRLDYHQSIPSGNVDAGFKRDYITLAPDPKTFQVVNAIYQDQAAGMASAMSFLECLLGNRSETPKRRETLMKGLQWMNAPIGRLDAMGVSEAFQTLFQGFSLPANLRAGQRGFLSGISSGDAEVTSLVQSLKGYLDTNYFNPGPSCEVALIPDSFLLGPPSFPDPLLVVPGLPTPRVPFAVATGTEDPDPLMGIDSMYAKARAAKEKARVALKDAIYAKAARFTKRQIEEGHQILDQGDDLLNKSNGVGRRVNRAINYYEKAEKIFLKAKEGAAKRTTVKPKVRVH